MNTTDNTFEGTTMPKATKSDTLNQADRDDMYERYVKGEVIDAIASDYNLRSHEVTEIVEAIGAAKDHTPKKDAK